MVALPLPELPNEISALRSLALDLRWTWSHGGDLLWSQVDEQLWERTHNPWAVLQSAPADRLKSLASDQNFLKELARLVAARDLYLQTPGWFRLTEGASQLGGVAYFSMEFGLGAALPLYAGGLGVLAGDFLKTASDLDVPVIGVGLALSGRLFPADCRRSRRATGILSLQRTRHDADRAGHPAGGRLAAHPAGAARPRSCSCASGRPRRPRAALSARQQRSAQQSAPIAASPASSTAAAPRCA